MKPASKTYEGMESQRNNNNVPLRSLSHFKGLPLVQHLHESRCRKGVQGVNCRKLNANVSVIYTVRHSMYCFVTVPRRATDFELKDEVRLNVISHIAFKLFDLTTQSLSSACLSQYVIGLWLRHDEQQILSNYAANSIQHIWNIIVTAIGPWRVKTFPSSDVSHSS